MMFLKHLIDKMTPANRNWLLKLALKPGTIIRNIRLDKNYFILHVARCSISYQEVIIYKSFHRAEKGIPEKDYQIWSRDTKSILDSGDFEVYKTNYIIKKYNLKNHKV